MDLFLAIRKQAISLLEKKYNVRRRGEVRFHPVSLEWAQVCRPLAGEYHHSFFKCSLLQDTVVVF